MKTVKMRHPPPHHAGQKALAIDNWAPKTEVENNTQLLCCSLPHSLQVLMGTFLYRMGSACFCTGLSKRKEVPIAAWWT